MASHHSSDEISKETYKSHTNYDTSENESESDDFSPGDERDEVESDASGEQRLDETAVDPSECARHEDKLRHLMSEICRKELHDNEVAQKQLFMDYEEYLRPAPLWLKNKKAIQLRNVAYKLACDGQTVPKLPLLLKLLVEKHPDLLKERDMANRGALDYAVVTRLEWFIEAVLDSDIKDNWQEVLSPMKTEGEQGSTRPNCIHAAISKGLSTTLTIRLIERASGDILTEQDEKGLTPLHHAVEYSRCTRERRRIVKALLEHGDSALDKQTSAALSVYQQIEETKKKYYEKKTKRKNGKNYESTRRNKNESREEDIRFQATGEDMAYQEQKNKNLPKEAKEEAEKREREQILRRSTATESDTCAQAPATPNQPNEGRPRIEAPPRTGPASTNQATNKPVQKDQVADNVANLLKLHYFRSIFANNHRNHRDHASAVKFLYGDNHEDKLICFDFPPVPRKEQLTVDFDQFKDAYKLFNFDSALLYVDFRTVRLEESDSPRAVKGRQGAGKGRRDMIKFFNWLRNDKKVQNIMKVSVEDRGDVPHSDEAIIKSLEHFSFEILDWRKPDLCPFIIRQASNRSKNLRELHLWWSGSNAVLRAWSEPHGLALLKNLNKINIYQANPPIESTKRTENDMLAFETRLNDSRKSLLAGDDRLLDAIRKSSTMSNDDIVAEVRRYLELLNTAHEKIQVAVHSFDALHNQDIDYTSVRRQGSAYVGGEKIDIHEWLNIMDTFAGGMHNLWEKSSPKLFSQLPHGLKEPITVALIDDGVDFMHPAISDKLLPGRSFNSGFEEGQNIGAPEPYHGSTTGHGTVMAYSIQRVCPAVRIFPYKIAVIKKANGPATFTARSAADAVEDAVKRGFDIISMSWTVLNNSNNNSASQSNSADLERLKQALQKATKGDERRNGKEILLFSSAPDAGQSNENNSHFPYNCTDLPKMFRIGAAKADGTAYSPVDNRANFLLPGEQVIMKESDMVVPNEDTTPRTGSSLATAHAAGLAAMILHCVRMGAIYNFQKGILAGVTETSLRAIKTHDAMERAFQTIRNPDSSHAVAATDRRLGVETFFKDAGAALSKDSDKSLEQKWIRVTQIARNLVSDNTESKFRQGGH